LAQAGRAVAAVDSLLAATADAHGLIFVTGNVRDVADLGDATHNPWVA
jgi:predicted nucleic acid-binding protein